MLTGAVDMAGLDREIARAEREIRDRVFLVCRMAALQLLRLLVLSSPVVTGHYRRSHMLDVDNFSREIPPAPVGGQAPNDAVAVGAAKLPARGQEFAFISLSNNLVYAPVLEWGGERGQRPQLIYTRAVDEMVRWARAQNFADSIGVGGGEL